MGRFWTFLLLGPPLGGWFTLIGESGTLSFTAVIRAVIPYSYVLGGLPALGTAIVTAVTARHLRFAARLCVAVLSGGILSGIYLVAIGLPLSQLPAIGALSALVCALLYEVYSRYIINH